MPCGEFTPWLYVLVPPSWPWLAQLSEVPLLATTSLLSKPSLVHESVSLVVVDGNLEPRQRLFSRP